MEKNKYLIAISSDYENEIKCIEAFTEDEAERILLNYFIVKYDFSSDMTFEDLEIIALDNDIIISNFYDLKSF